MGCLRVKVLGRLVLRGNLEVTAVDRQLINNHDDFPDAFVARAYAHNNTGAHGYGVGSGATATASAADGAMVAPGSSKVAHFYLHVLAESFAKNLPSARRGVEQLGALAGKIVDGEQRKEAYQQREFIDRHLAMIVCAN